MTDTDSLDDADQCIIYYNQAVIYYHSKRFGQALSITEKLYTFLEPLGQCFPSVKVLSTSLLLVSVVKLLSNCDTKVATAFDIISV